MTIDIDRLRELLDKATPGPWAWLDKSPNDRLLFAARNALPDLLDALEAAEADAESAYARGFHDAQTKARVEGRLVIVDSPELVELRAEIARLRESLSTIAEYLPSFDYVGLDEFGPRADFPGSPFDRGRDQEAKHLSGIARAALEDTP